MIGLIIRSVIAVAANAVGLIVAAVALDGMDLDATSFIVAVVIFTIVFAVLTPFLAVQLRRLGNGAIGATALIATLVSLIVTDLLSDGFEISGVGTWIGAAVIVWLAALVAAFILPFLGLKKYMEERRAWVRAARAADDAPRRQSPGAAAQSGRRRSRNARNPS